MFQWVDQFELQSKEVPGGKGKEREPGNRGKRGAELGEDTTTELSQKKHKKVCGDDSSDSSDGDDLHELKPSDFGWSRNDEVSEISSIFLNPELAKKSLTAT